MQVRELEREIGAELVERRAGDIALTETGLEVARRSEHILAATHDLIDFARHRGILAGKFSLGIIPTLAPYVLPRVLPSLQAAYPELRPEIRETQTKTLLHELGGGDLDAVLLAMPTEGADVETLGLFNDPFLLALPATDPLPARGRVAVDDVDQRRLILLEEGHCLRDQALAFCGTANSDAPASLWRNVVDDRDADGRKRLRGDVVAGSCGQRRGSRQEGQALALCRTGTGAHDRIGLATHFAT